MTPEQVERLRGLARSQALSLVSTHAELYFPTMTFVATAFGRSRQSCEDVLALIEERVTLRADHQELLNDYQALVIQKHALIEERDRLREALLKYGRHRGACYFYLTMKSKSCDCGLSAALGEQEPKL